MLSNSGCEKPWIMVPVSRLWVWVVGFLILFLEMSGPESGFTVELGYEEQNEFEDILEP